MKRKISRQKEIAEKTYHITGRISKIHPKSCVWKQVFFQQIIDAVMDSCGNPTNTAPSDKLWQFYI